MRFSKVTRDINHEDGCSWSSTNYEVDTDPDYNAPECKQRLTLDSSGFVFEYGIDDEVGDVDENDPNRGPYGTYIVRRKFNFCPICGVSLRDSED